MFSFGRFAHLEFVSILVELTFSSQFLIFLLQFLLGFLHLLLVPLREDLVHLVTEVVVQFVVRSQPCLENGSCIGGQNLVFCGSSEIC